MDAFRQLARLGFPWAKLSLPAFLAFATAASEALLVALLVPLIQILIDGQVAAGDGTLSAVSAFFVGSGDRATTLPRLVGVLTGLIVFRLAADFFGNVALLRTLQRFLAGLRQQVWDACLHSGKAFLDRQGLAGTSAPLVTYVGELGGSLVGTRTLVVNAALTLAYTSAAALVSWRLFLAAVAIYPPYRFLAARLSRSIGFRSRQRLSDWQRYSAYVTDCLKGLVLLQAGNQEARASRQHAEHVEKLIKADLAIEKRMMLLASLQELLLPVLVIGLVVASMFTSFLGTELGAAQMLVFLFALRRVSSQVAATAASYVTLQRVTPISANVAESIRAARASAVPSGSQPFSGLRTGITLEKLSFSYGEGPAVLKDVSLKIAAGRRTAIVGPSGSGKSTILSLLVRFYDVPAGTIHLDGVDLRAFETASLRRKIAYVGQDALVLSDDLRGNLTAFVERQVADQELTRVLEAVRFPLGRSHFAPGLDTRLGDGGIALSGGEKQRLALARAFLLDPEVVLVDEPSSALDAQGELDVFAALETFTAGRTLVAISHRLAAVAGFDHIVVMQNGAVVEQGSARELTAARGVFASLWATNGEKSAC